MAESTYQKLEVWRRARMLVKSIYILTKDFPKEELYALTNQIRRAAVSIPSNIAERRAKRTTRDFMRFINMACGSVAELETQLLIAEDLGYVSSAKIKPLLEESGAIGRMLNAMFASLEKKLADL